MLGRTQTLPRQGGEAASHASSHPHARRYGGCPQKVTFGTHDLPPGGCAELRPHLLPLPSPAPKHPGRFRVPCSRPRPITSMALTLSQAAHIQPWLQESVPQHPFQHPCPLRVSVLGPQEGHPQGGLSRNNPLGLAHHLQVDGNGDVCIESSENSSRPVRWASLAPVSPSLQLGYPLHQLQESLLSTPSCQQPPRGGSAGRPGQAVLADGRWSLGTPSESRARAGFLPAIAMPAASCRASRIPGPTCPARWNASTHPPPAWPSLLTPVSS